jgi:hypothetical protein
MEGDIQLMFYRYRHDHPILFAKDVLLQRNYQDDHCVVAINGIPESEMVYFEATLRQQFPQICQVFVTKYCGAWEKVLADFNMEDILISAGISPL